MFQEGCEPMPEQKFPRRAEWIWRPRQLDGPAFATESLRVAEEANRYVHFRLDIQVAGTITSAKCLASADGRYQLYVNGVLAGRGPGRCSPSQQSLDDYDLAGYLRPGRNVIAVLAHAYGRHTAWYELPGWEHGRAFGCGGFFLQGEVIAGSGSVRLDTGPQWRCQESAAWRRDVPSNSLGWMEHYDARRAPCGWTATDYDDREWPAAQVLRLPGRNFSGDVVPFGMMVPRRIPPMREALSVPARVVAMHETDEVPTGDLAEQISRERLRPLTRCAASQEPTTIRTEGERAVVIVYDCGEVLAGYIHLDLDGPAGAIVDVVHGEQLLAGGRVRIFGGIDGFDPVPAHRYVLREGAQSWERFEWSGLRYLQLTIRRCPRPLRVGKVALRETGYPVEAVGSFECSDPLLDRIWQAGATTLRRCMHDGYVDCPSREQRQWMDGYLSARINYVTFGDARLAAQMLSQVAQSQQPDGLTMMAAPGDFARLGFTNIPEFCLYWIMMIDDLVLYTGERGIVRELFPAVMRALCWFERHLDDEGLLADLPHWVFVDWAELDKRGQVTAVNAHFVAALRAATRLADICRYPHASAHFDALAERVCAAINALLWDPERRLYVDARQRGVRGPRTSQQANAAAIAYGVAPPGRWQPMLDSILDETRLVLTRCSERGGAAPHFDEQHNITLAQPFFMHFVHRALRVAGQQDRIVGQIRKRWADMLAHGETTLRETWQRTPTTSLCHAWSGTPTFDLSTDVLGVTPLAPGFDRMRIAPTLADLDWAQGRYPTPHGVVEIDWSLDDAWFRLEVRLPDGCEAECICPLPYRWQTINGAPTADASLALQPGTHCLTACR